MNPADDEQDAMIDASDEQREAVEDSPRDDCADELDGLRIRQLAALRRGAYRVRSYLIVGTGGCAVAAIQLFWMAIRTPRKDLSFGYLLLALLTGAGCVYFARRISAVSAELKHSKLDAHAMRCAACGYDVRGIPSDKCPECGAVLPAIPPPAEPDFSTLSDGSQQWKNLDEIR